MNEALLVITVGFMLASYSVVANDSIQTLGTFLYSNSHRKWWVLWLYSSSIMVAVMLYGWANNNGDVSYDRLDKIYSKMVPFKPAEKSIKASIEKAETEENGTVLSQVQLVQTALKHSKDIYLSDNTILEGANQELSEALNGFQTFIETAELSEEAKSELTVILTNTQATIEPMMDHRNVADFIKWYYLIPPVVLLLLTYFGFPVSTSFLILISIQPGVLGSMLTKSVSGYFVAFGVAFLVYLTVMRVVEKHWRKTADDKISPWWVGAQWISTAFLWSMWLIQDMANIFVYVPRPLPIVGFALCIGWMVVMQGVIYYIKGGKIQQIVTTKTNTHDIRSATIVDLIYGIVLYYFKILNSVPMSTTWVFIGLLAGRELAFSLAYRKDSLTMVSAIKLAGKDLGKVLVGLLVSIALAYGINYMGSL